VHGLPDDAEFRCDVDPASRARAAGLHRVRDGDSRPCARRTVLDAVFDASGSALLVDRTANSGTTWRGPTTLTDDTSTTKFKPWMASSPDGTLGVMWRSYTEPGASGEDDSAPYTIWAAISRDGGAAFSKPLEISTAPSPAADPNQKTGGDDFSFIDLDARSAFVAWADWRPGEMSRYFSAVDLQAFRDG
jgi:hypothetical protein